MAKMRAFLFLVLLLNLGVGLARASEAEEHTPKPHFEYPSEGWIIESQDYFGEFIEWDFTAVGGIYGDGREWVFTWRLLLSSELEVNPIYAIREAWNGSEFDEGALREIYNRTPPLQFKTWGDFKSDVSRLDKYPIVPEDKEEFVGLQSSIDLFHEDEGSFLVKFKDQWNPGKKITIGFGSTITYSGVQNSITCVGGTRANPIGFWDLWNTSNVLGWNVVNNTCDTQFKFWCKIVVGDGVNPTWFNDTSKQVVFTPGAALVNPRYIITVRTNAYFTLGSMVNRAERTTMEGCELYDQNNNSANTRFIYNNWAAGGNVFLYSSKFYSLFPPSNVTQRQIWLRQGDTAYNDLMEGVALRVGVGWPGVIDGYNIESSRCALLQSEGDRFFVYNSPTATGLPTAVSVTLRNLLARNNTFLAVGNPNVDHYLIDTDTDVWFFNWQGVNNGEVYRQYSFDLRVMDSQGNTIQGARVTIDYRRQGGGRIGSWLTDSNGRIPSQTISKGFYNRTGGNTLYRYEPFEITIKRGENEYEGLFNLDAPTSWEIVLKRRGAYSLLMLFAFSACLSVLFWYNGSILAGATSAFGWILTAQYWIYANQDMSNIGLFWVGLGVVNLVLTFYSAWVKHTNSRRQMRVL